MQVCFIIPLYCLYQPFHAASKMGLNFCGRISLSLMLLYLVFCILFCFAVGLNGILVINFTFATKFTIVFI